MPPLPIPDQTVTLPTDPPRDVRVLAVIPQPPTAKHPTRAPVELLGDPDDPLTGTVRTLLYDPSGKPVGLLTHPAQWTDHLDPLTAPLACEVAINDVLPPGRKPPGRPQQREDREPLPQVVTGVRTGYDGRLLIVTRDPYGQVRQYRREPQDRLDVRRPYVRRRSRSVPATPRVAFPEVFEGPFTSPTGAQFVFQVRRRMGGRLPASAPRFDPTLPPQFDARTGDLIPYVVVSGGRSEQLVGTWRDPSTFSETARAMPEVRYIIDQAARVAEAGSL